MRKLLIFSFFIFHFSFLIAQNEYNSTSQVWTKFNRYESTDADIFRVGEYFYIDGTDTVEFFISTKRSLGMVWFHGTVTGSDTLSGSEDANVVYSVAAHTGDGTARNTDEAETFYLTDSVTVTSGATGAYKLWPMKSDDLKKEAARYYTLRFINRDAGEVAKIKLTIEWIDAFKKY